MARTEWVQGLGAWGVAGLRGAHCQGSDRASMCMALTGWVQRCGRAPCVAVRSRSWWWLGGQVPVAQGGPREDSMDRTEVPRWPSLGNSLSSVESPSQSAEHVLNPACTADRDDRDQPQGLRAGAHGPGRRGGALTVLTQGQEEQDGGRGPRWRGLQAGLCAFQEPRRAHCAPERHHLSPYLCTTCACLVRPHSITCPAPILLQLFISYSGGGCLTPLEAFLKFGFVSPEWWE